MRVITAVRRLHPIPTSTPIFAPYASTTNFEITLMAKAGMPYIISGGAEATKGIISKNPEGFPTVWSRVPDYGGYSTDLPPLINKNIEDGNLAVPAKTVYIIGSDDPYGTTIADGLKESFTKAGWTVVGTETVPFQSVTDWRTQLAKIREVKPGMIVLTEWSPASDATFFNQFIEQPTDSLLFEQYAPVIPEFNEMTHNKATGVIFNMLGGAIDSRDDTKDISKRFAEKFGPGGYFSVAGYSEHDGLRALHQQGRRSGRSSRDRQVHRRDRCRHALGPPRLRPQDASRDAGRQLYADGLLPGYRKRRQGDRQPAGLCRADLPAALLDDDQAGGEIGRPDRDGRVAAVSMRYEGNSMTAPDTPPLLDVAGVGKSFGALVAVDDLLVLAAREGDPRHRRSERRRQDGAVQPDHRHAVLAGPRQRPLPRHAHRHHGPAPHLPARPGAHLPEGDVLRQSDGRAECPARRHLWRRPARGGARAGRRRGAGAARPRRDAQAAGRRAHRLRHQAA